MSLISASDAYNYVNEYLQQKEKQNLVDIESYLERLSQRIVNRARSGETWCFMFQDSFEEKKYIHAIDTIKKEVEHMGYTIWSDQKIVWK